MNENTNMETSNEESVEVQNENVVNEQNEIKAPPDPITPTPHRKQTRTWPWYTTVFAVIMAIVMTFFATFCVLQDAYQTSINKIQSATIKEGELSTALEVVDYLNKLFKTYYYYDVDYDTMVQSIVQAYCNASGDPYAYYYSPEAWEEENSSTNGNSVGIGVNITVHYSNPSQNIVGEITVTNVITDSGAYKAGLQKKDKLIKVGELDIEGAVYADILNAIRGEIGTTIDIVIERNGEFITIPVERCIFASETVLPEAIKEGDDLIGYVLITGFEQVTPDQFKTAMESLLKQGCTKFVFDLRNNGGGYLNAILEVLDYLLPEGPIVTINSSDGSSTVHYSKESMIKLDKAVVLINGNTASAAELFTSALHDYNYATLVGTKTYGKGCGQTFYPLPNGGVVKFTTFLYTPPYSENYDGIGIYPDVEVELDEEAAAIHPYLLEKENDAQYKAAIKILTEK